MATHRLQAKWLRKRLVTERKARSYADLEKQKILVEERTNIVERLGDILFADAKVFEKVPQSFPWIENAASRIVLQYRAASSSWLPPATRDNDILQTALDVVSVAMDSRCDVSITDIATKLHSCSYAQGAPDPEAANMQAVFASIGTLTMIYEAGLPGTDNAEFFNIHLPKVSGRVCSRDDGRRGLPGFLQNFDDFIPRWTNEPGIEIMKSELDCYTLTRIARINIEWTDLITMHLHYQENGNILYLFRYPVFCLLNLQKEDQITFFSSLFPTKPTNKAEKNTRNLNRPQTFMREVLLSYYLLFGHDRRSSKVYRTRLRPKMHQKSHCDPWLDHVCSSEDWKLPIHNPSSIQSKSIYNTSSDFMLLGSRLARLKRYCDAQQSRTFWDFWRDRRNPFNFYTFWAVIIIGVLSLVFSIAQCALSAAQLKYAISQGR